MKVFVAAISAFVLFSCTDARFTRVNDTMKAGFRIKNAASVSFYSSADGYAEHVLKIKNGLWEIDIPASASFRYFLNVDGGYYLPGCRLKENDGFGGRLCIYEEEK